MIMNKYTNPTGLKIFEPMINLNHYVYTNIRHNEVLCGEKCLNRFLVRVHIHVIPVQCSPNYPVISCKEAGNNCNSIFVVVGFLSGFITPCGLLQISLNCIYFLPNIRSIPAMNQCISIRSCPMSTKRQTNAWLKPRYIPT